MPTPNTPAYCRLWLLRAACMLFFVGCAAPQQPPPTATATMTPAPSATPPPSATPTTAPTVAPSATPPAPTPTMPPQATLPQATPTDVLPNAVRGNDGVLMHLVPAGIFDMGENLQLIGFAVRQCEASGSEDSCEESEFISEAPYHEVVLDAFYMDETEVTNLRYRACVENGDCGPPADRRHFDSADYDNYPVVFVTWHDARTYCESVGKRLPTEAEWERAATDGGWRMFPWGDDWDTSRANTQEEGGGALQPVGRYSNGASPFGILDLAGNAWEWVSDWYDPTYYEYSPRENPLGPPSGGEKVLRGGGFGSYLHYARATNRGFAAPDSSSIFRGFRCVMSAP